MFVVKFNQTSNAPFIADKNGNFPFIGEVFAGSPKSTLINGTMFIREELQPNKLYVCQNVEEVYEGKTQYRVQVIEQISALELSAYVTKFGNPVKVKAVSTESPVLSVVGEKSPF